MSESVLQIKNIALVTGGSSGIGKAIVERLLNENFKVVNADLLPGNSIADSRYYFKQTDITKGGQVQELFNFMNNEIGLPAILICNAGKGIHEKLSEGDPEKWFNVINTNLMGTLRILRSFLPGLKEKSRAHIVIISSFTSKKPYAYGGIYSASKAALDMIAETLRLELNDTTKVTLISPGIVDTEFFSNLESGELDIGLIGLGALKPEEVADAVLYAISSGSDTTINQIILSPNKQKM